MCELITRDELRDAMQEIRNALASAMGYVRHDDSPTADSVLHELARAHLRARAIWEATLDLPRTGHYDGPTWCAKSWKD